VIGAIGLAPSEDLAFVARQRMRTPEADPVLPPIMWALLFAAVLTLIAVVQRVV
jgi:hypothetical protein